MPIANKPLIAYTLEILERSNFTFPKGVLIATRHDCVRPLERYLETFRRRNLTNIEHVTVPQDKWGSAEIIESVMHKVHSDVLVMNEEVLLEFSQIESFVNQF
jgi:NDP-sugar pyrophosphorylase family protein